MSQVNRSAIYTAILQRNSLRREAKLPSLDVRQTYLSEVAKAEWRAIVEAHYDRVAGEILSEQRRKYLDWGNSWGGRLALRLMTEKALRERYLQQ